MLTIKVVVAAACSMASVVAMAAGSAVASQAVVAANQVVVSSPVVMTTASVVPAVGATVAGVTKQPSMAPVRVAAAANATIVNPWRASATLAAVDPDGQATAPRILMLLLGGIALMIFAARRRLID